MLLFNNQYINPVGLSTPRRYEFDPKRLKMPDYQGLGESFYMFAQEVQAKFTENGRPVALMPTALHSSTGPYSGSNTMKNIEMQQQHPNTIFAVAE